MSRRNVDRAQVTLLALSHGVDDLYQGAVPALLPFFVADRHYSYAAVTGLVLALTALSSVIQPVFGALTDRRNLFWLVPVGLGTAGVGIALSGLMPSYPLTFLAVALGGVGVAAFHPEAARAARVAAGDSQQAMSGFSVGGNIGYALGPLAVSAVFLGAGNHDLRVTGFLAAPALVTAAIVFAILTHQRRATPTRRAPRLGTGHDDWHGFWLLSSVVVVRSIVYFGITSLVALYVGTGLHAGKFVGDLALTTFLASGALGTVTGGRLADRHGRLPVTRLSFVAAAAGLVVVVLTPSPWVFLPIALTGFSLFQSFSLTVTLGQDYLPTRIGTSSGVTLGLAISVGGLLAPALGALADATSLRWALVVLVPLLPVALGLAVVLRDPRRCMAVAHEPLPARAAGDGEPDELARVTLAKPAASFGPPTPPDERGVAQR
jgi:MFS transporter, FSR family, fosmidomycin resistance protein